MKKTLLAIILIMICTNLFAFSPLEESESQIKMYIGSSDRFYVGGDLFLKMGKNLALTSGIKTYVTEDFEYGGRFKPEHIIFSIGFKYDNFGYKTFCNHSIDFNGLDHNKKSDRVKYDNIKLRVFHRIYWDIEQGRDDIRL
jgi:hypothetical protein